MTSPKIALPIKNIPLRTESGGTFCKISIGTSIAPHNTMPTNNVMNNNFLFCIMIYLLLLFIISSLFPLIKNQLFNPTYKQCFLHLIQYRTPLYLVKHRFALIEKLTRISSRYNRLHKILICSFLYE